MILKAGTKVVFLKDWIGVWKVGETAKLVPYRSVTHGIIITVPNRKGQAGWRATHLLNDGVIKVISKKLKLNLP